MKWLSEVGPSEWFGHGAIEVGDEGQHFIAEIVSGGEVAASQNLTDQNAQPQLHLVQPRRVLRRVVKDHLVRSVGQEGGSGPHRFEDAVLALDAQVEGTVRDLGHVAHQALRAVGVQVVRDEMPLTDARVAFHGGPDVSNKVSLIAGWSD